MQDTIDQRQGQLDNLLASSSSQHIKSFAQDSESLLNEALQRYDAAVLHYADEYKLGPRGQLESSIVATLSQCVRQQISFIRQQEEARYQSELKSLEGKSISSIRYNY